MNMRRNFLLTMLLFAAFTLGGCSKDATPANTVKVGAILPLTGTVAFVGEPERAALELALEDIRAAYGNDLAIELTVEDSGGDPKTAVSAANKLIDIDGVEVLVVSLSRINLAVAPIVKAKGVVHFATTTSDIGATRITPTTYRVYENFGTEMELLANFAKKDGIREIIGVRAHDFAIDQAFNLLAEYGRQRQIEVREGAVFEAGQTDYRNELQKIPQELAPDQALVFLGYGPEFPAALRMLSELGRGKGKKLGMYTFLSSAAKAQGTDLLQGVQFSGFAKNPADKSIEALSSRIRARLPGFSQTPFINYVYTYDAMRLIGYAAYRSKVESGGKKSLIDSLKLDEAYQGVGGPVRFDENRDSPVPLAILEYEGETVRTVWDGN